MEGHLPSKTSKFLGVPFMFILMMVNLNLDLKKVFFLGYLESVKGYKVQINGSCGGRALISRDVVFKEENTQKE